VRRSPASERRQVARFGDAGRVEAGSGFGTPVRLGASGPPAKSTRPGDRRRERMPGAGGPGVRPRCFGGLTDRVARDLFRSGRSSHVFGLLARFTCPLAIMPSADQVPVNCAHSTMQWRRRDRIERREVETTGRGGCDSQTVRKEGPEGSKTVTKERCD
jgi:hypothetical protein